MAHRTRSSRDHESEKSRYRVHKDDMSDRGSARHALLPNVGHIERIVSGVSGLTLVARNVGRPFSPSRVLGVLTGGGLIYRAMSGYCPAYGVTGIDTTSGSDTSSLGRDKVRSHRAIKVDHFITINRPPEELYRFWRRLDNLPQVMPHVRSVTVIDDRQSHWVITTLPGAPTIEWDAVIINEVENERIGWRTVEGASVAHAGSVHFEAADEGRRTIVTVVLQYDPPAGPLGAALMSLLGEDPEHQITEDLERFKTLMESEGATTRV
jgi:uncharacterized membrane protein